MLYLSLFISFFKVGLLGFGGGMAVISLIENEVLAHGWMTETEFVDIVAVSQVTPGPIGMNCATYAGYTATGSVLGSLVTSFAIVLPGLIIMLAICTIYDRLDRRWSGNRAYQTIMRIIRICVVVLVAHAAWTLMTPATFADSRSRIIFGAVLLCMLVPEAAALLKRPELARNRAVRLLGNPVFLMALAGVAGYVMYS